MAGRDDCSWVFRQYGTVKDKSPPNMPMRAQRGGRIIVLLVINLGARRR